MGGRTYDPDLGQMMQADAIVQSPLNGQNYNRYSYVFNNPMSYTDPTGFAGEFASSFFSLFSSRSFGFGLLSAFENGDQSAAEGMVVNAMMNDPASANPGVAVTSLITANRSLADVYANGEMSGGFHQGGILDLAQGIGSGLLNGVLEAAHNTPFAPNELFAGTPGFEITPADLCGCGFSPVVAEPTTNIGQLGSDLAPAISIIVGVLGRNPRTVSDSIVDGIDNTVSIPRYIYRTGSQTDNALTDTSGVSFRETISSSSDMRQVFKPKSNLFTVDTSLLPDGSVVVDGVPHGHVSVFANAEDIRKAIVPHGEANPIHAFGLKQTQNVGSYKLPKD